MLYYILHDRLWKLITFAAAGVRENYATRGFGGECVRASEWQCDGGVGCEGVW